MVYTPYYKAVIQYFNSIVPVSANICRTAPATLLAAQNRSGCLNAKSSVPRPPGPPGPHCSMGLAACGAFRVSLERIKCVFSSWFQRSKGKKEFRLGSASAKHSKCLMILRLVCTIFAERKSKPAKQEHYGKEDNETIASRYADLL